MRVKKRGARSLTGRRKLARAERIRRHIRKLVQQEWLARSACDTQLAVKTFNKRMRFIERAFNEK